MKEFEIKTNVFIQIVENDVMNCLQLLVDTQLFSVLSDSRLSSFENGFGEVNASPTPKAEVEVQHKVQMKHH